LLTASVFKDRPLHNFSALERIFHLSILFAQMSSKTTSRPMKIIIPAGWSSSLDLRKKAIKDSSLRRRPPRRVAERPKKTSVAERAKKTARPQDPDVTCSKPAQKCYISASHSYLMFEQAFKNIDDVLRKEAGCTTELDYTEQSSWLLFLKYLNDLEEDRRTEAALNGKKYAYILDTPYRWASWAAPKIKYGKLDHSKVLPETIFVTSSAASSFLTSTASGKRPAAPTPLKIKLGRYSVRSKGRSFSARMHRGGNLFQGQTPELPVFVPSLSCKTNSCAALKLRRQPEFLKTSPDWTCMYSSPRSSTALARGIVRHD
jgi:hypothetical protein